MSVKFIGATVNRVEDPRLLTGRGRFVDDVRLPGMLHAAFVRSTVPHGRVTNVDAAAARALPGVVAVLTASDLNGVCAPLQQQGPPQLRTPVFHVLATDRVRFVGDPLAIVIAESRYVAEDACDLVVVDIEPLPPIASAADALQPGAARLYDELPDNIAYFGEFDYGDVDAAFAGATRVVRHTFAQHRYAGVPMETRGGVAAYDPASGELVYHAAHKAPHSLRMQLSRVLAQPEHRTNVLCGDVGGAFGQKGQTGREDLVVCAAAKLLGQPVKWIEDRSENLTAGGQAREETLELSAALGPGGEILGLAVTFTMDAGAYPSLPIPMSMYPDLVRVLLPNGYRVPAYRFVGRVVFTNKDHYVSYRGPWASETWARERLIDLIASELGIDRVEVRRRNLYTPDDMPTAMVTGPLLDAITVRETLERAVAACDYDGFRDRQLAARADGRLIGLGLATFIEIAPGPPNFAGLVGFDLQTERATVRVEPDGGVLVLTGQSPHGQGHETTLAQVVAEELGTPIEQVKVVHSDTRLTPFLVTGTGGSRSATMASGAVLGAAREVRAQVVKIAAELLEAAPDDLDITDGRAHVRGSAAPSVSLAEVAARAYLMPSSLPEGMAQGIAATYDFRIPTGGGWSQATHCCVVEVARETGRVDIVRYIVVEDCGTMINPAVVEGQIRGGVAQGIGGVLYERSAYGDDGQFLASTFLDYLLPTACEVPDIEVHHLESAPTHEVNFRGVGEGGTIGAPAALTNAIADAIGVPVRESYLPPSRVLELLAESPFAAGAAHATE
ncbi:MAG TPA: xanthine dehydrogenase family protein molybdopterin-binding subunit [Acidimicrobiales bacterium]|nr:xanthine dehydrogenase family protein molybdopterin-binding subunit [Acidimicrobiales bacterium]